MRLLLLTATVLLSACAPGLRASAWHHDRESCWQEHDNGMWERDFCRDGKGVLVWIVWTV